MKVDELSLDIWRNIINSGLFELGTLHIEDVLNLIQVNSSLNKLLKDNSIWGTVYDKVYGNVFLEYEVQRKEENVCADNAYTRFLNTYRKEQEFISLLTNYGLTSENYNIGHYLDKYCNKIEYFPIVKRLSDLENARIKEALKERREIDISRSALLANLNVNFNYYFAIDYLANEYKQDIILRNDKCYELFWFKISHFDNAFTQMIELRRTKLQNIVCLLHEKVTMKILYDGSWDDNVVLKTGSGSSRDIVIVKNELVLRNFFGYVIELILSNFKLEDTDIASRIRWLQNSSDRYFLEDFSLIRVYAGASCGHPMLINSIIVKMISDLFTSKYDFMLKGSASAEQLQVSMTKTFIYIKNLYFMAFHDESYVWRVDTYSINDVVHFLRQELNIRSPSTVAYYLKPLTTKDMLEFFFNIPFNNNDGSFYEESQTEALFAPNAEEVLNQTRYIPRYSRENYHFASLLSKLCQIEHVKEGYAEYLLASELEKSFNTFNNFIHFKTLMQTTKLAEPLRLSLQKYFRLSTINADTFYKLNFDLNDAANSRISFGRMTRLENLSSDNAFPPGTIVGHLRSLKLGVVIGRVTSNPTSKAYYKVYTSSGSVDTFSESSLQKISSTNLCNEDLLISFFQLCRIDILALLYFKSLTFVNDQYKFVPCFKLPFNDKCY